MITTPNAYALSRVLAGHDLNGEAEHLPEGFRRMVDHLAGLPLDDRPAAWMAMMAARDDGPELVKAMAMIDPSGPPPEPEATPALRPANKADVRAGSPDVDWLWEGYIPWMGLSGIAAFEGVGKTRLALDIARRIWHGLPWPDGQAPTLPAGTPTLWVCADGQQREIVTTTDAFAMPDEAVWFNTPSTDPLGGASLDGPEDLERLEAFIREIQPGMVFIDTLTNAISYDLCRANDTKEALAPLRDIALRNEVVIVLLMHLSKEGQALGRRSKGWTRTVIHLEAPDCERSGRLRLWVEKSCATHPPALGVTMGNGGNEYDHNPPTKPEPGKVGRPPEAKGKAEAFIREKLTEENNRIGNELAAEYEKADGGSKSTFWRAVDAMEERDEIVKDGGKGTGKQTVLHLIRSEAEPVQPEAEPEAETDPDQPF